METIPREKPGHENNMDVDLDSKAEKRLKEISDSVVKPKSEMDLDKYLKARG